MDQICSNIYNIFVTIILKSFGRSSHNAFKVYSKFWELSLEVGRNLENESQCIEKTKTSFKKIEKLSNGPTKSNSHS